MLTDRAWTPWLPIYAWAIEHPEGVIVVDAGESARAGESGYYPALHPYYRRCVQVEVAPEQELGPQLSALGITPADVRVAILTHMHSDHVGGLWHLTGVRTLVSRPAHAAAVGPAGRLFGYMPQHWPAGFAPEFVAWSPEPLGPFDRSLKLTRAGDIVVVPTPGHTPGHVSVVVRNGAKTCFIAGDASYTEEALIQAVPDGLTPRPRTAIETHARISSFVSAGPTVYLPSHDPASEDRLRLASVVGADRTLRRADA